MTTIGKSLHSKVGRRIKLNREYLAYCSALSLSRLVGSVLGMICAIHVISNLICTYYIASAAEHTHRCDTDDANASVAGQLCKSAVVLLTCMSSFCDRQIAERRPLLLGWRQSHDSCSVVLPAWPAKQSVGSNVILIDACNVLPA